MWWLIIGVIVLLVVFFVLRSTRSTGTLEDRLNEMAALGQPLSLEDIELSRPFSERVIVPFIKRITETAQKMTPQHALQEAEHQLNLAGMLHKIKPAQFYVMRMGGTIVMFVLLLVTVGFSTRFPLIQRIAFVVGGGAFGYYAPVGWLSSKIRTRQDNVQKALPDALDLLTICVEAGLGFDAAMSKVASKWDNELSNAFARTVQEMQLGKLRREALRSMADGMNVPDLTSFAAAIIQADQLGVSMAKVMRIQSEQMRMKRRQRAEEKARQAPVKIMFPLVFFIFPTILIVLLGPSYFKIRDSGLF